MIGMILKKIMGTQNERVLKRIQARVDKINALEPEISRLTDAELRARTDEFKRIIRERTQDIADPEEGRRAEAAALDEILPEAF
ncbi:MAG TPA: hypothetical protein VI956_03810, partial [Nitrospirota bacterium]|nr:hypothetical protein [Nitrospirota bacterium]